MVQQDHHQELIRLSPPAERGLISVIVMRPRIGELLVREGLLSPEMLKQVLAYQRGHGGKIASHLLELGLVKSDDLARVLSLQLGFPTASLHEIYVGEATLRSIPEGFARSRSVVPVFRKKGLLEVAMADPQDRATIEDLQTMVGVSVVPLVATELSIRLAVRRLYRSRDPVLRAPSPGTTLVELVDGGPLLQPERKPKALPLIPRAALLGPADVIAPQISPDGRRLSSGCSRRLPRPLGGTGGRPEPRQTHPSPGRHSDQATLLGSRQSAPGSRRRQGRRRKVAGLLRRQRQRPGQGSEPARTSSFLAGSSKNERRARGNRCARRPDEPAISRRDPRRDR